MTMAEVKPPLNYEQMWNHIVSGLEAVLRAPDAPESIRTQSPETITGFAMATEAIYNEMRKIEEIEASMLEQKNKPAGTRPEPATASSESSYPSPE